MGKVFFDLGISLDGYIAGPNAGPTNPMGGVSTRLHHWVVLTPAFRRMLKLDDASETSSPSWRSSAQEVISNASNAQDAGLDDAMVQQTFDRIGANVMGKRMFLEGEASWPEEAPFHNDVFVLTHEKRDPWPRPGGTVFHFVNDGIEAALECARASAGDKDVRISGGAETVMQYLNAGHIEEFWLHVAPLFLGQGVRLFDGIDMDRVSVQVAEVVPSPHVTHIRYDVKTG